MPRGEVIGVKNRRRQEPPAALFSIRRRHARLCTLSRGGTEGFIQLRCPKQEDPPQVRAHKQPIHEPAAQHTVVDAIGDERASLLLVEGVFVNPPAIRAAALLVDEPVAGPRR
jgi:hypothetical protein